MVITQNDVGNDIKMITESLSDKNRPLVSPVSALKIAMLWPGLSLLGYIAAIAWITLTSPPVNDAWGDPVNIVRDFSLGYAFTGVTIVFGLAIGAGMYGPALFYLTIPESIRGQSTLR